MWVKQELDLTYCTNIHAGESWDAVEQSLREYAPALKARLSPGAPFGLGLRLSAVAARQLCAGDTLLRFKAYLDAEGLYVSVINGFPYGSFHGEVVKANVFAPDWTDEARAAYTLDLVEILAVLLPEGADGGISTMPLSYKPWAGERSDVWNGVMRNLVPVVARMAQVFSETGRTIHLDIEPEPNGLIESTGEFVAFFNGPLQAIGAPLLAEALGISVDEADEHLRRHVQICFDVCHMAVGFEDVLESLELLREERLNIGRVQISSALRVPLNGPPELNRQRMEEVAAYVEPVYLHQVVESTPDGGLTYYADLDKALAATPTSAWREWRIHFHVPIFLESFGALFSTQDDIRKVIAAVVATGCTKHLEVETYTWSVLPKALQIDLRASIERELRWVLDQL